MWQLGKLANTQVFWHKRPRASVLKVVQNPKLSYKDLEAPDFARIRVVMGHKQRGQLVGENMAAEEPTHANDPEFELMVAKEGLNRIMTAP